MYKKTIKPKGVAAQEVIDFYQTLSFNHKHYLMQLMLQYDCELHLFDTETESVVRIENLHVASKRGDNKPIEHVASKRGDNKPIEIHTDLDAARTHCWSSKFRKKPKLKMVGPKRVGRPRKVKA
jgi:hypothetical protein